MRPVGEAVEFAQFPICTHEGREAGRLRPHPFAALFPTKQKRRHAGNKSAQRPNNDFHRETFREMTGTCAGYRSSNPARFLSAFLNIVKYDRTCFTLQFPMMADQLVASMSDSIDSGS